VGKVNTVCLQGGAEGGRGEPGKDLRGWERWPGRGSDCSSNAEVDYGRGSDAGEGKGWDRVEKGADRRIRKKKQWEWTQKKRAESSLLAESRRLKQRPDHQLLRRYFFF